MSNRIHLNYDFYYNPISGNLYLKDEPIHLSKTESKLLALLYKNQGEIVKSDEIETHIWEDYPIKDSTRRTLIYRLKKKLDAPLIEHIPRVGCKLVLKSIKRYCLLT